LLYDLDLKLLYFLNREIANPVFDYLCIFFSEVRLYLIPVLIILALFFWRGGAKARLAVIILLLCVAAMDTSTYYLLKNLFARLRPCHALDGLRLIVGCGGLYGFPSNHAVNSFSAATILSLFYRRYTVVFYAFALVIGLSRVYLGKHYPGDILAGALWGIFVAIVLIYALKIIISFLPANRTWSKIKEIMRGVTIWKNPKINSPKHSQA
jgi:undecaprenyl-diphosphatase